MLTPRHLGRYEVVELLGHGGMASLYRARDPRIGRYVAIKQLRPQFDTPDLRERFSREAAAAGGLSHPNIVTIYDVGEEDGLPFIAMEFVQGETFADLVMLRPPLAIPRKIQLTEEVCAGLAHAHEAGIVHRDIKPANLIVGPEGTVKILDFGVAKLAAGGTTLPGAIIGTLNYLSPEQINGVAVDTRADIFSVGAVLYELLSHRQAFPGRVPDDVFQQILHGAPALLSEIAPGIDLRLVELVQSALEKDPDQRIQDISSLQRELAIVRLSLQAAEPQRSAPRRTVTSARSTALQTPPPLRAPGTPPPRRSDSDLAGKRAKQIADHLAQAELAFESGDYDGAIESCKQVLLLDEMDERAVVLLDRIHAAIDEQQERDRLAERERRRDASIRLEIEEARRLFADGQYEVALQSLENLDPSSHPLVADALADLRSAFEEVQEERRAQAERAAHRRRVNALIEDGRAALQNRDLGEAERLLGMLRDLDAEAAEMSGLAELVSGAQAAARLNEQVEGILREFDSRLAQDDLSAAADRLEAAAALAGGDMRVRAARRRLDEARADLSAREAAEARRLEGEQHLNAANASLEGGDLAAATERLALAVAALTPQHAGVVATSLRLGRALEARAAAEAAERLRQDTARIVADASRRFESAAGQTDELLLALRDVDRALTLSPGHPDAQSLKATIEASLAAQKEAARVKAVISNARTRFANGKHQAALQLLEEFQPSPNADIDAVLTELRAAVQALEEERRVERERIERQERVALLLESARAALRERRFDAALEALSNAGNIDAAAPDLAPLLARVQQEQEAARLSAELDRLLADLHAHLSAGDLTAARALLESAEGRAPADLRVQGARQRIEQAMAARAAAEGLAREAEEQYAAAKIAFEKGDVEEAGTLLTRALTAAPKHEGALALSNRVAAALKERADAEAARRQRQAVDDLVAAAAALLQDTDVHVDHAMPALEKVTEALALDPRHEGALALKAAAENALLGQRQARAAIRNARNRFSLGKHHAAIQLLENLDAALHPLVADTVHELREALAGIEERRRREKAAIGDATVLIPMPAGEPKATAGQSIEARPGEDGPAPEAQNRARLFRWGVIVVAAVTLIVILIVLYRLRVH